MGGTTRLHVELEHACRRVDDLLEQLLLSLALLLEPRGLFLSLDAQLFLRLLLLLLFFSSSFLPGLLSLLLLRLRLLLLLLIAAEAEESLPRLLLVACPVLFLGLDSASSIRGHHRGRLRHHGHRPKRCQFGAR